MTLALVAALLTAATPAGGKAAVPAVRHAGTPGPAPRAIRSAEDLAALCRALTPPERLRPRGDAVERGEAEARHDADRDAAIVARYAITLPAARLPFAPYDASERRLSLAEPGVLPVAEGGSRLWPSEERGLPVEADAGAARRVLEAQRAGRLALELTFDLPDDATCGADPRGKTFTLPVEPVEWAWTDGGAALARGGAGADRPLATAAQGATPRVDVGEPIAGPSDAKRAVLTRAGDLQACYAEALRRDPAVDGVLVVELGGGRIGVAADSTGTPELSTCVQRALATLAAPGGGRVAVPIRFELVAPATAAAAGTGSAPAR
ncbi:hypothetical protein [Anaeromyxobacter sp. PSR-1]|uniref:hypothetical protein n=1 Tax=Anaeromyxobacter sp. PSR-1 TaxID=1300915 RepID=UPI0005E95F6C|nr:hypothetical protein [Anaeromyxobacter sp. PSR-1]GAO04757.1 hypothetical protein PSR1_03653 [Anaeromyxobacter sp. PSR-1]